MLTFTWLRAAIRYWLWATISLFRRSWLSMVASGSMSHFCNAKLKPNSIWASILANVPNRVVFRLILLFVHIHSYLKRVFYAASDARQCSFTNQTIPLLYDTFSFKCCFDLVRLFTASFCRLAVQLYPSAPLHRIQNLLFRQLTMLSLWFDQQLMTFWKISLNSYPIGREQIESERERQSSSNHIYKTAGIQKIFSFPFFSCWIENYIKQHGFSWFRTKDQFSFHRADQSPRYWWKSASYWHDKYTDIPLTRHIVHQVLDSLVKEICAALLASDVNVMLVQRLRANIKKNVNLEELANGANKKRMIEKVLSHRNAHTVEQRFDTSIKH